MNVVLVLIPKELHAPAHTSSLQGDQTRMSLSNMMMVTVQVSSTEITTDTEGGCLFSWISVALAS